MGKRDKKQIRNGGSYSPSQESSISQLAAEIRGLQPDEPHVKKFMPIVIILAFKIIIGEKYSTLVTLILL
jgi:hypothetical protein